MGKTNRGDGTRCLVMDVFSCFFTMTNDMYAITRCVMFCNGTDFAVFMLKHSLHESAVARGAGCLELFMP